jgi:hypothetical protein
MRPVLIPSCILLNQKMTLDTNQLGNWVRNYVHYDNLASSLSKQLQNARKVKDDFESKIISSLEASNMSNAVIQIAGGKLTLAEEKHANALTLTRLEELLHNYYKSQGRQTTDETLEIMKYIKAERGSDTTKKLKKTVG